MAKHITIAHIGRNVELRTLSDGRVVTNIGCAYRYGRKDPATNKQPTQWVDAALWGKRAEALAPYLVKGQAVLLTLKDAHVKTFQRRDGSSDALIAGDVLDIELVGSAPQVAAPAPPPPPPPPRSAPPVAPTNAGEDFEDDDIPF